MGEISYTVHIVPYILTFGAPSVPGRVVEALHALPQVLSQQARKGSSSGSHCSLWRLEFPEESKASLSQGATNTQQYGQGQHCNSRKSRTFSLSCDVTTKPRRSCSQQSDTLPTCFWRTCLSQGQVNLLFDNSLCPAKGFSVWTYF